MIWLSGQEQPWQLGCPRTDGQPYPERSCLKTGLAKGKRTFILTVFEVMGEEWLEDFLEVERMLIQARIDNRTSGPWWVALGAPLLGVPILVALLTLVS